MEKNLPEIAKRVRKEILGMVFEAGSGHIAGSFSSTDILVSLYFGDILEKKDKFVLSAGHYCPAYYSVLAEADMIPKKELKTLRSLGSRLQGHPHNLGLPGIVLTSSGPLGQGLSQAAGLALAAKMDPSASTSAMSSVPNGSRQAKFRVYCLMSDAEQQEGQIWEAAMFSAKYKLDNLVGIIDKNGIQIDGTTEEIMPLGDLGAKYLSFGWETMEIDGHNFGQILDALETSKHISDKPTVIIARTIPGKGVSFMEGKWQWHVGAPTKKELEKALKELK